MRGVALGDAPPPSIGGGWALPRASEFGADEASERGHRRAAGLCLGLAVVVGVGVARIVNKEASANTNSSLLAQADARQAGEDFGAEIGQFVEIVDE